ncbi:putative tRNA pseudouridine(38-40) synthase [Helianthus annuus]|nr:putative tRNA pseudouridine(38-40) synthase [Helianthus annuus]KAJ0654748.1 putative tRNA pseudouridine(38-40) synthase [Helianthus annuus]
MENQTPVSPPPLLPPPPSTTADSSSDHNATDKNPRHKRKKVAILFAYCGAGYLGMQKNPGAKTIEGELQQALCISGAIPQPDLHCPKIFDFARSARTDKGVSAIGQVVSGKFYIDPPGFVERINNNLPEKFRVFGFKHVTASFSSKKCCVGRRYVYLLPVFALDCLAHRDRGSVLASLGSGNELVRCFECSERGRKVFGAMDVQSGISSNTWSVVSKLDNKQANLTGLDNGNGCKEGECSERGRKVVGETGVKSSISSNTCSALSNFDSKQENLTILDNGNGCKEGLNPESVIIDNNFNGENSHIVKENVFCYGDKERQRFNKILKQYEGTHNFHNFTTKMKATDPAANRNIISFHADTTVTIDGIEFVKCEVVGQSFMLHQIRKMIGVAVAVMRNCALESLIETALRPDVKINVPTAPEVGLYLEECFFSSYNEICKATHEEVSMKDYAEEAEEFKLKHIYPHIASTEHKEGTVAVWLHSLNYRNYPDLCPEENRGANEVSGTQTEETTRLLSHNYEKPSHISSSCFIRHPSHYYEKPTVHWIDLEHLATAMKNRLNRVLPYIHELRVRYGGVSDNAVTDTIISDVNMMVDTAMSVTYNRLRFILQSHAPTVFVAQMNPKSPLSNKFKFPAFISSVLGSIGPLRIMNGLQDALVVYATSPDRSKTCGRAQHFEFISGHFFRLIDNLEAIGVPLAPIDVKGGNRAGSCYPTILLDRVNGWLEFTATCHYSNYKHRDIDSAWLTLNDDPALRAFPDCSLRIECCTNPDVMNAVIASRPEGVPDDVDGATAPARPVGLIFNVNEFGVRPAVAAEGGNPAVPAAFYIVGRGTKRYFCTSLARGLTEDEMTSRLREYIMRYESVCTITSKGF